MPTLLSGLVDTWHYDESSGTRSSAVGGRSQTATNNPLAESGIANNAAKFALSSKQFLSLSTTYQFAGGSPFSISWWAKTASNPASGINPFWANGFTTGNFTRGFLASGNTLRLSHDGNNNLAWVLGTVAVGTWHHYVLTMNGTNAVAYYDTVSQGSKAWTSSTMTFRVFGSMGAGDTTDYLDGDLDEVAIFNYALSSSDVSQLYNHPAYPWGLGSIPDLSWDGGFVESTWQGGFDN